MKLISISMLGFGLMFSNIYALETKRSSLPVDVQRVESQQAQAQQSQPLMTGIQNKMQTQQEMNKVQGEKFLANNKNQPGVVTLPDGLQYKILVAGVGEKPKVTDTVSVNYAGTSIDGKEFDSSYKRNAPTSFPVNAVIAGWTEALQMMPVGSTWELYIPSDLAYGQRGAPPSIGPNEVLIFKVELLEIKK